MASAGVVAALVRRDYLLSSSYPLALGLELAFGVVNLLIYFFISRTFAGAASPATLAGAPSYFAFAAVGVALSLVVQTASTRVALRIREEQTLGTLEILMAQPINSTEMCLGLAGFQFLFGIIRAVVYLTVAGIWLDVDVSNADWPGFVLLLSAAALAMTSIGIGLAGVVVVVRQAQVLVALTTLVLGVVGGAFFPVDVLPGWLRPLAIILPTRLAFDGARAALFRGEGWADETLVLLGFSAAALPVSILAFRLALDLARRRGSLSGY